jgi:hypothetical protein
MWRIAWESVALGSLVITLSGCMNDRGNFDDRFSSSPLEEETRRSTVPSAMPATPPPDQLNNRQIPPRNPPGIALNGPAIETVPNKPQAVFLMETRQHINALARHMAQLEAVANQKDAVGRAAIAPSLREFNKALRNIDESMHIVRAAAPDEFVNFTGDVDLNVDRAARAVADAQQRLSEVRAPTS